MRVAWWVLFAVMATIAGLIRIRLLGLPLERDEGEYAYAGQLMLQGIPPYQLAYSMKFPGTHAAYALIMSIFGQTTVGVHLGLLVVNAATVLLILLLGRRLFGTTAGLAAGASYAVLSVSPTVLGFAGHATHFVVLPVLGAVWLLLGALDRPAMVRLFASGVLFGVAVLMKQSAIFFALFGLLYLLSSDWRSRLDFGRKVVRGTAFVAGAALPFAVTCLLLWRAGVFEKFWFWTFHYAREYGSRLSISDAAEILASSLGNRIGSGWLIWAIAAAGLILCVWKARSRPNTLLLALLFFAILAVCPGFYFREHYFILVLPAISLLVGVAASRATDLRSLRPLRMVFPIVFAVALSWPFFAERDFFFTLSLDAASWRAYGANPFRESVRIASYLREHTDANDTLAVLGSEPQIYFYANRHSATGYIYIYGLMEPHQYAARMQQEMVQEIEAAHPKYVVFVAIGTSWLSRPDSEHLLIDWFNDYSAQELKPAGYVGILSADRTDYYLPYGLESLTPAENYLTIWERRR